MKVVIVAKTRMGSGACVGGLTFDGRSLRLDAADRETDDHFNMDFQVGEVWNVETRAEAEIVPPHVENVTVVRKSRSGTITKITEFIEGHMPPVSGGVGVLFDGLTNATKNGTLYIAERSGIPGRSTMFWRPDKPLKRDEGQKRIRYRYPTESGGRTLTFVGFQEPIPEIPAGTLMRVSLAHWWRPEENPDWELRCYVQISGWFLDDSYQRSEADSPSPAQKRTYEGKMPQIEGALQQVFGYAAFLPLQREVIEKVLRKENTLAVMPTGSGKSMCYQLPSTLFPGLTVVVSPLISLMEDQVLELDQWGVPAVYLNSTLTHSEYLETVRRIKNRDVKLLYAAPETLLRPETIVLLEGCAVDCLVIDESHCISEWGHDFRPEYRQLVDLRSRLPQAVTLALTATATERVRVDIKETLGILAANEFVSSFNRPNLYLSVTDKINALAQTRDFLDAHSGEAGIIYCATRDQVDNLAMQLGSMDYPVLPYHAGMESDIRRANQRRFRFEEGIIMVATIAFGMGINKSNVRFILHYDLPKNLENYYQQIGRSGRDGLRADCLVLYSYGDIRTINFFINQRDPKLQAGSRKRLDALLAYLDASTCRRVPLLVYFGETYKEDDCGACDNCQRRSSAPTAALDVEDRADDPDTPDVVDLTIPARQFISCVRQTGEIFGMMHIILVLRGSKAKKVLQFKHDQLDIYDVGRAYSKTQWRHITGQLLQQGLLERTRPHGSLKATDRGKAVLEGGSVRGTLPGTLIRVKAALDDLEFDRALFEELRGLRAALAKENGLPPYVIFHDRSLVEMATYFPQTPETLGQIYGVGRQKVDRYGPQFLPVIKEYCEHNEIQPQKMPTRQPPGRISHTGKKRMDYIWERFQGGESIVAIASELDVKQGTVLNHLRNAFNEGRPLRRDGLIEASTLSQATKEKVSRCFDELGVQRLKPIFDALDQQVPYDQLHLWRLIYQVTPGEETNTG
jgi:ATP-dependent DNA helicase RecQ